MKARKRAIFLLLLGLANLVGVALGSDTLKGLALATSASPAPKVFTTADGLETFSSEFELAWTDAHGARHRQMITYVDYPAIRGPYNRRNVFGAVLAYGPVLASRDVTRPMFEDVSRYALCGEAPLLRELGIAPGAHDVLVHVHPREGTDTDHLPLTLEAPCH